MRRVLIGLGVAAAAVLAVLAVAGVFGGSSGSGAGPDPEDSDCAGGLAGLIPSGSGAQAYTMGIRVNQASDVDSIDGAIGDRILPRDVFVINTERAGSGPDDWQDSLSAIEERFPCNRIAALNGLGTDSSKAGYMQALADEERVATVMLDWEADTWESAGRGAWDNSQARNLARIEQVFTELTDKLESGHTSMGIVPDYLPPWDYARTAKKLGALNFKIDPLFRGFQIVQTQPNCGDPGAPGPLIGPLADRLRGQYRPLFALAPSARGWVRAPQPSRAMLEHLGFEIAFSTSPDPSSSEAVSRTGPAQAAACSRQIVDSGGAGILYWADADSLKAMLDTPAGRRIRASS